MKSFWIPGRSEVCLLSFSISKLSSRVVDHTLSFLLSSAQSHGIPHKVIRNLTFLNNDHRWWVRKGYYNGMKRWNPQRPPSSLEYDPRSLLPKDMRTMNRRFRKREAMKVDEQCWDALGEAVRMAEARHNLSFGRIRLKRWSIVYR